MSSSTISVRELIETYIDARKQGMSPINALGEVRKLRSSLNHQEQELLLRGLRQWEKTEGTHYPLDPDATINTRPETQRLNSKRNTLEFLQDYDEDLTATDIKTITLTIPNYEDSPIVIEPYAGLELILGRSNPTSGLMPDIDLVDYGGAEYGVSRIHAILNYQDGVLTISDLNSANYTFLNGERVHPREVRLIKNQSEIRLGRLPILVSYEY